MKYVTLRRGMYRFPVIFPDMVEHAQFAGADLVSAGFFSVGTDEQVCVYGKATSRNGLGPKLGDDTLIRVLLDGAEATLALAQDLSESVQVQTNQTKP